MKGRFVDFLSLMIAGATLLISFLIFFRDTKQFMGSLVAALMTAGLVWVTYLVLRWLLLANRD
jgi:hypothetical protein